MNAVERFARLLAPECVRRLAALETNRFASAAALDLAATLDLAGVAGTRAVLDVDAAHERVVARWADDLCGLLNAMTRGELAELARRQAMPADGRSPELREQLWARGAQLERGAQSSVAALQPTPIVLGGHLVVQAPPRGLYPASEQWPRLMPEAVTAEPPADEPDTLDELIAAADRAIGVRLGRRGADKGAWGVRAATLLGVIERGGGEPDWRGDVEIKTVPVARENTGCWRVVEDPAIAMSARPEAERDDRLREGTALAKLQRTLWLARADVDDGDATIVSWYLLEWDAQLARLARRYLHERPKGPAGTDQRALYLHKRFFADAGMLATLNGPARPRSQ